MAWEEELDASSDEEFVPAVFARSMDEAEELRQLLEDHGIEAVLGDEVEAEAAPALSDPDTILDAIAHGVAVLVPDMYLDEASEIIADREDADEFEPDDETEEDEDDDEFALGDEEDEDAFFQIEEEDDEPYDEDDDDYLDEDDGEDEES